MREHIKQVTEHTDLTTVLCFALYFIISLVGSICVNESANELLPDIVWPMLSILTGTQIACVTIVAKDMPRLQREAIDIIVERDPKLVVDKVKEVVESKVSGIMINLSQNTILSVFALPIIMAIAYWIHVDIPIVTWPPNAAEYITKSQFISAISFGLVLIVCHCAWDTVKTVVGVGYFEDEIKSIQNDDGKSTSS